MFISVLKEGLESLNVLKPRCTLTLEVRLSPHVAVFSGIAVLPNRMTTSSERTQTLPRAVFMPRKKVVTHILFK